MKCKYEFERKVNQVIWHSVFSDPTLEYFCENGYENSIFEVKPYNWNDEEENEYHFWHKPSGFKLQWYKYPLRSPMVSMEITHEQFLDILRDCHNSVHKNCWYDVKPWWEESEVESTGINNYERIKNMSLEEMAVMLADEIPHGDCFDCFMCSETYEAADPCTAGWKKWLEEGVAND